METLRVRGRLFFFFQFQLFRRSPSLISSVAPGRCQELVGEPGGAGAAAGLLRQHGRHPADGEGEAADRGAGVQEGAGRPADAAGGPGPEDLQLETEAQRPGRDGTARESRSVELPTVTDRPLPPRAGGRRRRPRRQGPNG